MVYTQRLLSMWPMEGSTSKVLVILETILSNIECMMEVGTCL